MIAAVGVEVRANLYNGQGQHLAAYSRVVGTNSRVSFVCPTGDQYMSGSAIMPSTVDIHQGTFIPFWDADADDCGETFNVIGPRQFYMPWKRLKEVAEPTRSHFGISTFAKVYWTTNLSQTRSSYNPDTHTITFGSQSYANKWTAAHEFAHAMHEKRLNGLWSTEQPACSNHEMWEASGYRCALQEGFADYAASIVSGWPPNFENPPSDAEEGPDVEGRIAAMFHDLIDSANGSGDATTYSGSSIATAFKTVKGGPAAAHGSAAATCPNSCGAWRTASTRLSTTTTSQRPRHPPRGRRAEAGGTRTTSEPLGPTISAARLGAGSPGMSSGSPQCVRAPARQLSDGMLLSGAGVSPAGNRTPTGLGPRGVTVTRRLRKAVFRFNSGRGL